MNRLSSVLVGIAIAVIILLVVMNGVQIATSEAPANPYERFVQAEEDVTQVAPPRPNGTVFTTRGPPGVMGHLIAIHPNGTLQYHSNTHDEYWDVDPVNRTHVIVSATDEYSKSECPVAHPCSREYILRVNLESGNTETLYARYRPHTRANEWHDVDRISRNEYLIADMEKDRVFVVNTSTGIITWSWDPQSHYNISTGGSNAFSLTGYPRDWTHLRACPKNIP